MQYSDNLYKNRKEARSFGVFLGGILVTYALYRINHLAEITLFFIIGLGIVFILLGFIFPSVMFRLRKSWIALGRVMHKVMMPLIMGILFVFIFTPIAVVLKIVGRDLLKLKFQKSDESYWVAKDKVEPETMREQF